MKVFIAFTILIAGISALPPQLNSEASFRDSRIVTDAIASTIEELSQNITNAGLDPYYIEHQVGSAGLHVPVILSIEGELENFLFKGLSNIVIHNLNFSVVNSRLRLGLTLPHIEVSMDKADSVTTLFGSEFPASVSGRFAIKNLRVDVELRISLLPSVSIRSMTSAFKLGTVETDLEVNVVGYNLSEKVNKFLGATVPKTLDKFEDEVNELIAHYAIDIINDNL